jgi:hypothetical protein
MKSASVPKSGTLLGAYIQGGKPDGKEAEHGVYPIVSEIAIRVPMRLHPAELSNFYLLIDGAQGGMDSRKWVEDTPARSGASPWDRLEQRVMSAGARPPQVQVVWMKHAVSLKNDARRREFGGFPNYARQLQGDMAQLVRMLKKRYPNLRLIYVSSRSYGGYATTPLNPEPYAYESAFGVRGLIQDQIKGEETLSYEARNVPLLLWGPYLWGRRRERAQIR